MSTIKFVRVERDCPHNKNLRRDGEARGLIYDFDVMIDGEKRAEMHRAFTGKGYTVQDADGRPVDPPVSYYQTGRQVGSKSEFLTIVTELLDAGKIPTLSDMAAKREAEAEKRAARRRERLDQSRLSIISANGLALYNALAAFRNHPDARDVLAGVDREVADAIACIDE